MEGPHPGTHKEAAIKAKSTTATAHCTFTIPTRRVFNLLCARCFYELRNLAAYVGMARTFVLVFTAAL